MQHLHAFAVISQLMQTRLPGLPLLACWLACLLSCQACPTCRHAIFASLAQPDICPALVCHNGWQICGHQALPQRAGQRGKLSQCCWLCRVTRAAAPCRAAVGARAASSPWSATQHAASRAGQPADHGSSGGVGGGQSQARY